MSTQIIRNVSCTPKGHQSHHSSAQEIQVVEVQQQGTPQHLMPFGGKSFYVSVNFNQVPLLAGLHGSVFIDPNIGGQHDLCIHGTIPAFSGLSTVKGFDTSTVDMTVDTATLVDGSTEISISAVAPNRVNGATAPVPTALGALGYNFRNADPATDADVPLDHIPINVYAGSGTTAGDIYFSVAPSALSAVPARGYTAVGSDGSTTNLAVEQTDNLKIAASTDGISITGDDVSDTINIGLHLDPAVYNNLSLSATGLLSNFMPEYFDTGSAVVITSLDTLAGAQALPIGSIAIWDNDDASGGGRLVRKVSGSGSDQWINIDSDTGFTVAGDTGTNPVIEGGQILNFIGGTGIDTNSDNPAKEVTVSIDSTVVTSADSIGKLNDVNLTVPPIVGSYLVYNGTTFAPLTPDYISNFSLAASFGAPHTIENGNTLTILGGTGINTQTTATDTVLVSVDYSGLYDFQDTPTANITTNSTSPMDISVDVPLRLNSNPVTDPSGIGIGYNYISSDGSVSLTNPSAGTVDFKATIPRYYNKDVSTSGNVTLTPSTNSSKTNVIASLTTDRDFTLSATGAVFGDTIFLSTRNVTFNGQTIRVIDGSNSSTIATITTNSTFEFVFDGTNWNRFD